MKTCQRCGYEWESRAKNPKSCPMCKSYQWNLPRKEEPKKEPKHYDENFDTGA